MVATQSPLMDVPAVAEYLGLAIATVRNLSKAGALPSYKMGKFVRFRREEVDTWLESKRRGNGR